MVARKTDEEKLQDLEKQMEQIKARKQQVETRLKEKERKQRTKRLIEVGAIFEKYFEIEGKEEAEKIALAFQHPVLKNKSKVISMSMEQIKQSQQSK